LRAWIVADRANRVWSLHRVLGELLWCSCISECRKSRCVLCNTSSRLRYLSRRDPRQIHVNWHNSCPNRELRRRHGPSCTTYGTGERTFKLPSLQLCCCHSRSTTFLNRTSSKTWTIKTQNKHQTFKLHSALVTTDFPTATLSPV